MPVNVLQEDDIYQSCDFSTIDTWIDKDSFWWAENVFDVVILHILSFDF